jgi:hypothetical protein
MEFTPMKEKLKISHRCPKIHTQPAEAALSELDPASVWVRDGSHGAMLRDLILEHQPETVGDLCVLARYLIGMDPIETQARLHWLHEHGGCLINGAAYGEVR